MVDPLEGGIEESQEARSFIQEDSVRALWLWWDGRWRRGVGQDHKEDSTSFLKDEIVLLEEKQNLQNRFNFPNQFPREFLHK
jgi:hypothetical protein